MEEPKFVLIKCTNCEKVLKVPENSASVFCLDCKQWTSIKYDKEDKDEKGELKR